MGELIALASGKGGTGKTSLCAGIAAALSLSGYGVLCLDCDFGLRNLDIALGLRESGAISLRDVCSGDYTLSQAAEHPLYPGLFFITAPADEREIREADLGAVLKEARERFDFILLDAPAGVGAGFRLATRFADRIVLVTGSDPAAIRDASRAAQLLELDGKTNVTMIVNRVRKKTVEAMGLTVDDIMDEAGLPLLGLVPEDPKVVLAAAAGQPLLRYPRGAAAAACRRIARRITGIPVPVSI